jgi:hypothetical protein
MNERIEKLAEQAGIVKPEVFYQHIDALQLEKFAELIVAECANIVSNKVTLETNEDYREGFHRAKQFIWQDINKHFGVEE